MFLLQSMLLYILQLPERKEFQAVVDNSLLVPHKVPLDWFEFVCRTLFLAADRT